MADEYPWANYPGFRDEDWREASSGDDEISDRDRLRIEELVDSSFLDHNTKHARHDHPWCTDCERRRSNQWAHENGQPLPVSPHLVLEEVKGALTEPITRQQQDSVWRWAERPVEEIAHKTGLTPGSVELLLRYIEAEKRWERHREIDAATVRSRTRRYLILHGRPPVDDFEPTARVAVTATRVDDFLDDEVEYDWLIRGLLERQDRMIVTGDEGRGKSTFNRQIAVKAAAGLHPFTDEEIDPVTALIVDLENGRRQVQRGLRPLVELAGDRLDAKRLFVEVRTAGVDLLTTADRDWLRALVDASGADLLVTGPAYKMAGDDPIKEGPARSVATFLDKLREEHGIAVLLESHRPYASNGQRRPERPYGASLWSRWPEFGLCITETDNLSHWRGARDERAWPVGLVRGGRWPFEVRPAGVPVEPTGRAKDLLDLLRESEQPLTNAEIREAMAKTGRKPARETISRLLSDLSRGDLVDSLVDPGIGKEKRWLAYQAPRVTSRDDRVIPHVVTCDLPTGEVTQSHADESDPSHKEEVAWPPRFQQIAH